MAKITETAIQRIKRLYPQLDRITDVPTNQTTRLLWDRVHDLEERLKAAQGTITTLVGATNTHDTAITKASRAASRALAVTQSNASGDGGSGGDGGGSGGGSGSAAAPTSQLAIVQSVLTAQGWTATPNNQQLFAFIVEVVWQISALGTDAAAGSVGLLGQAAGDGVYTYLGVPYATFRLCYSNGANIKVLTGSYTAQWSQEADVPTTDWRAPVIPGGPY